MMTGERILALFSALALQIAGLGVFLFWTIGTVLILTHNGGQINNITMVGGARMVYFAYPFLLVLFSIIGWLAFWRKNDLVAMGSLSVPVGVIFLLYMYLILVR